MASAPRKILRLPNMWAMTKPTSTRPVTAITTFLPTMVPHSTTAGLLDQTRRALLTGADRGRSAAVPSSNRVAIDFLLALGAVTDHHSQGPSIDAAEYEERD